MCRCQADPAGHFEEGFNKKFSCLALKEDDMVTPALGIVILLVVMFLFMAIKVLNEYERGVIFRLGRIIDHKGPGIIILIPIIDRMVRVSLRTVAFDVPPQDVITRDNVSVKVSAVIYFRVNGPDQSGHRS